VGLELGTRRVEFSSSLGKVDLGRIVRQCPIEFLAQVVAGERDGFSSPAVKVSSAVRVAIR